MSSSPETYPKPLCQGRPADARVIHMISLASKTLAAAIDAGCAPVVAAGTAAACVSMVVGFEEGGRGRGVKAPRRTRF